jgi:hypothetical protein
MTRRAGTRREEADQPAYAAQADLLAAYQEAVTRRDECLQAYVILCLYQPAPPGRESDWQLEIDH